MTKSMLTPNSDQPTSVSKSEKRAWVTPAFEQVPLKEALNIPQITSANDGCSSSS